MHSASIFILVLLFHENVTFNWMSVVQDPNIINSTTVTRKEIIMATAPALSIRCMTAKKVMGLCVWRQNCDYGSTTVDVTLYAPRWYKTSCKSDEVCCPYQYIRVQGPSNEPNLTDDYFQIDNDY